MCMSVLFMFGLLFGWFWMILLIELLCLIGWLTCLLRFVWVDWLLCCGCSVWASYFRFVICLLYRWCWWCFMYLGCFVNWCRWICLLAYCLWCLNLLLIYLNVWYAFLGVLLCRLFVFRVIWMCCVIAFICVFNSIDLCLCAYICLLL